MCAESSDAASAAAPAASVVGLCEPNGDVLAAAGLPPAPARSVDDGRGAAHLGACDGVVCFAGVDWWYHNRGHSECQIMTRLARRLPVLWVNSIGMRVPRPGKTELPFRRYARKLRSTLKGLRRDRSGMWVYSPLFVPRYTERVVQVNGWLLSRQIRLLLAGLGVRRPAAFVTIPTAEPAVSRLAWTRVVFNRSDDFSAFGEADGGFVRPLEERLLRRADAVLYVNRRLCARERGRARDPHYLGHGVDFDHFASPRDGPAPPPRAACPPELRDLPRPVVGFYGALDDYTVDLGLMVKAARRVPRGTLLVIGPKAMDIAPLLAEPNVRYLGPIPYGALPGYAAQFDVALMPWLRNDWIEGCNPIKLKEYLALGFPVVTTRFPELAPYESLVYAADTHEQFLAGLDDALAEAASAATAVPAVAAAHARRRASVAADSWEAVADRVAPLLGVGDAAVARAVAPRPT